MRSKIVPIVGLAALALVLAAARPTVGGGLRLQDARLRVAVYHNFEPFSRRGEGIDVELARRIGARLRRRVEVVNYYPGESVEDDIRYVLTRTNRADLMMHIPLDPRLTERVPKVDFVAPYYTEQMVVARDTARLPTLASFDAVGEQKIGVAVATLADDYLTTTSNGRLAGNVAHYRTVEDAVAALQHGEVAAIMGEGGELEAALGAAKARFPIIQAPAPGIAARLWTIGAAVRAEDAELGRQVDSVVAELRKEGVVRDLFRSRGVTYVPPEESAP